MATYNPRHFTDADVLLTISSERLLRLLAPYAEYFDDQGLPLPSARQAATLDVVRLAGILESPGESALQDLLNAIGYIDEMSTPSGMDALLPKAIVAGMDFDASEDLSPADIAVQVWLFEPTIVEREHIWHTWRPPYSSGLPSSLHICSNAPGSKTLSPRNTTSTSALKATWFTPRSSFAKPMDITGPPGQARARWLR